MRKLFGPVTNRRWAVGAALATLVIAGVTRADPAQWRSAWPRTDFSRHAVSLGEIVSGGPGKDGIPAIDHPTFVAAGGKTGLSPHEPVIAVVIGGEARAYPLRIMIWHEIVNDTVGGAPIAVTWCPLCNSSIVFDRRVAGRTLSFGTTGNLRKSDLVMYDRETESWWQQFVGECIVGTLAGERLKILPARVESIDRFRARFPDGKVLVPPDQAVRPYGTNPYAAYDSSAQPFLYHGPLPAGIAPLARVVSVGDEAWTLDLLKRRGRIEAGDLVLAWNPGQSSPLDTADIAGGRDIGNVVVQRRAAHGLEDVAYDESFAFAFHAFHPAATIHAQ